MTKYKVLWLDDDFQSPIDNPEGESEAQINFRRDALASDAKLAEDYGIEVYNACNYEEFDDLLRDYSRYNAVIFDLRGLDNVNIDNNRVMGKAKDLADKIPGLLEYVYSANIEDPAFDITIGELKDLGRCFSKALGPELMFQKIKDDLDSSLGYYKGHEECLYLLQEGYIDSENQSKMNNLLQKYSEKDPSFAPYNDMRHILENMLQKLVFYKEIKVGDEKGDSFNKRLSYISEDCETSIDERTGKKWVHYDKPLFPLSKCRQEIKYVLKYLGDITNMYSHFLKQNPDYLRQGEVVLEYNTLLQDSVYPAFFIAMKWYYGFMSNHHLNED